jgi:small subunit ribosomal protein S2
MATRVNIAGLVDAGVHFGHQTRKWNPKMKPYIFTSRRGIYIIDLKRTLIELDRAYSFAKELASKGGSILFVGTKKQAQEPIASAAERCGMPYVNHRWLGGMLTNFVTIRSRVTYMEQLEAMEEDGRMASLPKKEQILLRKELGKLQASLNGVRNMTSIPQAVFVVDTKREQIAIHEARRLEIPVIGILDTNADPDEVSYGIPGNDDAIRSVALITNLIADAIVAGATAEVWDEAEMIMAEAAEDASFSVEPADEAASYEPLEGEKPAEEVEQTTDAVTHAAPSAALLATAVDAALNATADTTDTDAFATAALAADTADTAKTDAVADSDSATLADTAAVIDSDGAAGIESDSTDTDAAAQPIDD